MCPVAIRPSPIHGLGLFAVDVIAAGQVILSFTGKLTLTDDLDDERIRAGLWQGISPGRALIRDDGRSPFSYINHGEPNAEVGISVELAPEGRVVATRAISPGEEILINYDLEPMDDRCRRLIDEQIKLTLP